jgi:hypothetical protein
MGSNCVLVPCAFGPLIRQLEWPHRRGNANSAASLAIGRPTGLVTPIRRTTRRYDRVRHNLDRHPTYALAGLV